MIYLDNNATTQVAPQVREAMLPYLTDAYGNPSSMHRFGQESRQAAEQARHQVAGVVGCLPREVVFTSGGTEADNAAIFGVIHSARMRQNKALRVVTSSVEHSAVREPLAWLGKLGVGVTEIGGDERGHLDMEALEQELKKGDVGLVSIMWANNETGVVFDVETIGAMARQHGAVMHVDAVQAVGKMPMEFSKLPIDLMSVSAHKFHGPKGAGALIVRRGASWESWVKGGPQERERRGGTENVAGIVGMGAAAELARGALNDGSWERVRALRDQLEREILRQIPESFVNGDVAQRVCNTTNIGFAGLEAEAILLLLSEREVCASAGAACASGSLEPSHVLRAMHIAQPIAHGAIRFSLSRLTTESDIIGALEVLPNVIARLRAVLPVG